MTVELYSPPQLITVSATGPHSVPFAYAEGAVIVYVVEADGAETLLDPSAYSVEPASSQTRGTLYLNTLAPYLGKRLRILRDTDLEQGWVGLAGERERGLETQLDRTVMAVQELDRAYRSTLRIPNTDQPPLSPAPGKVLMWNEERQIVPGPNAEDIAQAQHYGEIAADAAERAELAAGALGSAAYGDGVPFVVSAAPMTIPLLGSAIVDSVFISGLAQQRGASWSQAGNVLTINEPGAIGMFGWYRYRIMADDFGAMLNGVDSGATRHLSFVSGTGNASTFSLVPEQVDMAMTANSLVKFRWEAGANTVRGPKLIVADTEFILRDMQGRDIDAAEMADSLYLGVIMSDTEIRILNHTRPVAGVNTSVMVAYDPAVTRAVIDVGTGLYRHVPSIAVKSTSHLIGAYVFNDGSASESAAGQNVGIVRSFNNGAVWTPKINELAFSTYTTNPIFQGSEGTLLGEAFVAYDAAADQEIFVAANRSAVNNSAFIAFRSATQNPNVDKWTAYRILFDTTTGEVSLSSASISGAAPAGFSRQISIDGVAHDVIPCKPVWGRDGTLLLPLACITAFGASHWITILKRNPAGVWSRAGTIPRGVLAARGSWEPTIWEANDGTWYCQLRNIASGSPTYDNHVISWSDDLRSWAPFAYADEDIHQNRVLKCRGDGWYVGTGVTHYANRNSLSLMISRDGHSWVHGFTFGNEFDGVDFIHYSDICEVGGTIYAIYSQEPNQVSAPAPNEIRFASFPAPSALPIMGSAKKFYELGSGTIPSVSGSVLTIPPQMTGAVLTTGQDCVVTLRMRVTVTPNSNRYRLFDIGDEEYGRIAVEYRDNGGACELWCNNTLIQTVLDPTAWRDFQIAISRTHGVISVLGQARACRRFDRLYLGDYSTGGAQSGNIEIDASKCSLTAYPAGVPRQILPAMLPMRGADVFAANPSGAADIGVDTAAGAIGTLRYRVAGATKASTYWNDVAGLLRDQVAGVNITEASDTLIRDLVAREVRVRLTAYNFLSLGAKTNLIITAGVITPTRSFHTIDTEGGAATDDLISITVTFAGDILVLQTADSGRDVTVKHAVGNIFCGVDRTLNNIADKIVLICDGTNWHMIAFADN